MVLKTCHSAYCQDLPLLALAFSGEEPNGCLRFYTVLSVSNWTCPELSSLLSMKGHLAGNGNEVLLALGVR